MGTFCHYEPRHKGCSFCQDPWLSPAASDSPASTRVYLINTPEKTYSNNIRHIFAGGLLTIESMGITYDYSEQSIEDMLIWNEEDDSDEYGWGDYNVNPTLVTGGKLVIWDVED